MKLHHMARKEDRAAWKRCRQSLRLASKRNGQVHARSPHALRGPFQKVTRTFLCSTLSSLLSSQIVLRIAWAGLELRVLLAWKATS